jgi:integrase
MRLTDLSVRKLRSPVKGQKTYFDEILPGFGVRISQGGTKSYVVMYGPQRRLKTIGRFPDIKLSDARREAKKIQSEELPEPFGVASTREAISFGSAVEQFLKASANRNRPRTTSDYRRLLHRHFSFEKPVDQITRSEIMRVITKLDSTPSEQKHAFVAISTLMNWLVRQGIITQSPVPRMTLKTSARARILSTAELTSVFCATKTCPFPFGPIMRLLILTGQRRGEIGAMKWNWIDQKNRTVSLPSTITKNGRVHVFPFGDLVQEVFESLPQMDGYLFPSRNSSGTTFNGWAKSKKRFDQQLVGVEPYTLHDLRRTFASTIAGQGTPIHVTEKLLNHVSGTISGVAAIYNRHSYMPEMRKAVASYEAWLSNLISQ